MSIGGTPTSTGTIYFTVSVTDSTGTSTGPYTYTITVSAASALSIETTTLPGGNNGWAYSTYLKANGGTGNYTWPPSAAVCRLGSPLTVNNSGMLTGTPTAAGTAHFTVQVTR